MKTLLALILLCSTAWAQSDQAYQYGTWSPATRFDTGFQAINPQMDVPPSAMLANPASAVAAAQPEQTSMNGCVARFRPDVLEWHFRYQVTNNTDRVAWLTAQRSILFTLGHRPGLYFTNDAAQGGNYLELHGVGMDHWGAWHAFMSFPTAIIGGCQWSPFLQPGECYETEGTVTWQTQRHGSELWIDPFLSTRGMVAQQTPLFLSPQHWTGCEWQEWREAWTNDVLPQTPTVEIFSESARLTGAIDYWTPDR